MSHTHLTVPTRFVEVNSDRFAYRRWGNTATNEPPLFFLQHYRGGMDHWDPLMTDGLAAGREVILFNGRGPGASAISANPFRACTPRRRSSIANAC